jgi:L-asparaginase/Glu-tRNA(Gln) amidotransferase subunit D
VGIEKGGYSTVGIAFLEGKVVGVVFVGVGSGTVDTAYAEAFAMAQDQKIRTG